MGVAAALFLGATLAASGAQAQWAVVGAACSPEGTLANSNGFLVCSGGVWVANSMRAGNTVSTCNSGNAGYIRWSGSAFEGCNGTSWIQLAGGSSGLKVYKADGVTELGNVVGTNGTVTDTCAGIVYANASGSLSVLSSTDCQSISAVNTQAYFSGSNCTGAVYGNGTSYACTGAATCQTNVAVYVTGTSASRNWASIRTTAGVCVNSPGSGSYYATVVPLCQGPCLVK